MPNIQVLRVGKISSINYPNGTARVTYEDRDGATTGELPFIAWEYWMPRIADTVLVGHLSNGTASAVILGPFWHQNHRPAEGGAGLYRKEFSATNGQAYERYDAKANAYLKSISGSMEIVATGKGTLKLGGCTIEIGDGKISINAPGGIAINGDVISGGISLQTHTHTSALAGSESSKPN